MTNEKNLTEEFYDTFEIEPEFGYWCKKFDETNIADCNGIKEPSNKCAKCENGYIKYKYYPVITAEKLLQMICIINEFISMFNWKQMKYISTFEIETLKENILKDLIWILSNECNDVTEKQLKQQIQQLFKGAN